MADVAPAASTPAPTLTPVQSTPAPANTNTAQAAGGGGSGGTHLTDDQVEAEAERILKVGEQFGYDDYDSRLQELSRTLSTLDADSARRLVAEFFDGDGVGDDAPAMAWWMQADRVVGLQQQGRISEAEAGAMMTAVAANYNSGDLSAAQVTEFLEGNNSWLFDRTGSTPDGFRQIRELLNAGDPAVMDPFREKFATELLQRSVTDPQGGARFFDAAWASTLMADSGDPTMTARVYGSCDAADREKIFEAFGEQGHVWTMMQGQVPGLQDPLSQLLNSVAASRYAAPPAAGGTWADMATELVRHADRVKDGSGQSLFYERSGGPDQPIDGRAESLSRLFNAYGAEIVGQLTDPRNMNLDPTTSDPNDTLVGRDGVALGNLLRLTVFNPDNALQARTSQVLSDVVGDQRALLANGTEQQQDRAVLTLSYLGAAAEDAVEQAHLEIAADKKATEAFVNFVAGVALAAIPFGATAKTAAESALKEAFGEGVIRDALRRAGGNLVDAATGQLTTAGKAALTEALGAEYARLAEDTAAANAIRNGIFVGAEATGHEEDLATGMSTAASEIDRARG